DGIHNIGMDTIQEYDEVVLANNSCYAPIFPFEEMFAAMDNDNSDFWGVTLFPENKNSTRAEATFLKKKRIPRHLQSFFTVYRQPVVRSEAFISFWDNVKDDDDILKVVANYEVQLTTYLEEHGFISNCYIKESSPLQERCLLSPNHNAIYHLPIDFLILRCPFIKKKISIYVDREQLSIITDTVKNLSEYPVNLLNLGTGCNKNMVMN
ncbi:hypothetical protein KAR91_39180, partial [Candidatus Pacearchaeota archaeon]|nr:hypothetical protein [Candidatus Pacearchaeota archaeon]